MSRPMSATRVWLMALCTSSLPKFGFASWLCRGEEANTAGSCQSCLGDGIEDGSTADNLSRARGDGSAAGRISGKRGDGSASGPPSGHCFGETAELVSSSSFGKVHLFFSEEVGTTTSGARRVAGSTELEYEHCCPSSRGASGRHSTCAGETEVEVASKSVVSFSHQERN